MTRIALIAVVLFAACKIRNEASCDIPGNCADTDAGIELCANTEDCSSGVCKLPEGVCVECLAAADCDLASVEPVCNLTTNSCEGCKVNADCASEACNVTTGACFEAEQVAYLEAGGNGTCDQSSPCGTLPAAFDAMRPVIKVQGTTLITSPEKITVDRDLTIIGDAGATLSALKTTSGPTLEIVQDATVIVRDLELSGNLSGDAITIADTATVTLDHVFLIGNNKHGVFASGGTLVMRACVVSRNDDGGLDLIDTKFEITNTMIAVNGNADSIVGGVRVNNTLNDPATIFEFNTVADNSTMPTGTVLAKSGVNCSGTGFAAHNNIVAGIGNVFALDPSCTFDHSLFTGNTPSGTGNTMTTDVKFQPATAPRDAQFYRLQDTSPAIDQATTSAITIDIDGEQRPQGAEKDMGADEVIR